MLPQLEQIMSGKHIVCPRSSKVLYKMGNYFLANNSIHGVFFVLKDVNSVEKSVSF